METMSHLRNGVDVERLITTIKSVSTDNTLGDYKFRLYNEWISSSSNQSVIARFYEGDKEIQTKSKTFVCKNDESSILLGNDDAPNPAEYILHALAGCLTTSLIYHASTKGYKIRKVSSIVEGSIDLRGFLGIDGAVRNGYKQILIKFNIEGDFTEEEKAAILNLGPFFSPVFDIITNPVPVDIRLEVNHQVLVNN